MTSLSTWIPPLDSWQIGAVAVLAFLFGAFKTAFGISGSLVTPLMMMVLPAKMAVAVLAPVNLATDVVALSNHWRRWDRAHLAVLVPGSVLGVLIGTYFLAEAPASTVVRTVAVLAITYGVFTLWQQFRRPSAPVAPRPVPLVYGLVAGLFSGILGAVAHLGGLAMTVYLLAVGLRKEGYVATLVTIFFVQNLIKVPLYWFAGVLNGQVLMLGALMLPAMWLGGRAGLWVIRRLSVAQFTWLLGGLVLLAGIVLLTR